MPTVTQNLFKISANQMDLLYGVLETDLLAEIDRMRATGISDEEIYRRVSYSLDNGLGLFSKFKGAVEKEFDVVIGKTAQLESNEVMKEEGVLRWELDPTAKEHCVDCLRNSNAEPMSFEDWEAIGLPGMGNTECTDYCKCTLTVANV